MRISKLMMPALTLAGALALAGCGGGSDSPAVAVLGSEGNCPFGKKMGSDDCYTEEEYKAKLKKEAEEAAKKKADEDAAAKAAREGAENLYKMLSGVEAVAATTTAPTGSTPSTNVVAALGKAQKATNGSGKEGKAEVMVMTVDGAKAPAVALDGISAINAGTITGTGFATGSNQVVTHDGMTGTNKGPQRLTGTWNGASGVYSCGDTSCTSQRDANGITLTGEWDFDPAPGAMTDATARAEYGWWLDEGIEGDNAAQAGAWYRIIGADNSVALDTAPIATGTAKYTGTAIGQAAFYDSTTPSENIGGAFTADAELTATFGTSDMLEGDIKNFQIGTAKPEWVVKLKQAGLAGGGALTSAGMTEWTVGTGDDAVKGAAGGSWNAQLHTVPPGGHQPSGVVGGFESIHAGEGHMIGAFGASQ